MKQKEIFVNKIISSTAADDNDKGDKVYDEIIKIFKENSKIELVIDFDKIELINTAFLNNAIGKLFDSRKNAVDLSKTRFRNMDSMMIELLRETIMVANERYSITGRE